MTQENLKNIFEAMEFDIKNSDISEADKAKLMKNLLFLKEKKVNLLITGATGSGKSSTINAMFNTEVAKVGVGVDPETMDIAKYDMGSLILWDSPGLGDGKEADNRHAKNIKDKLYEKDENGDLLIDLVLVILDGSTRDLGTSYELINNVIIPNLGENKENRIIVAINQADAAKGGRHWNYDENKPEPELVKFLDEKAESVRRRIKEATGVDVMPIYYCAGYKEEGKPQEKPYNLAKLFEKILEFTPKEKRLVYTESINSDPKVWEDNDGLRDYGKGISEKFGETFVYVTEYATKGSTVGKTVGRIFGKTGEVIGGAIGGFVGGGIGLIKGLFGL